MPGHQDRQPREPPPSGATDRDLPASKHELNNATLRDTSNTRQESQGQPLPSRPLAHADGQGTGGQGHPPLISGAHTENEGAEWGKFKQCAPDSSEPGGANRALRNGLESILREIPEPTKEHDPLADSRPIRPIKPPSSPPQLPSLAISQSITVWARRLLR